MLAQRARGTRARRTPGTPGPDGARSPSTATLRSRSSSGSMPEPSGELVDQRLDRERRRRRGRGAVGAERHPVGRDAERGQLVGLPPVRAGGEHRRDRLDARSRRSRRGRRARGSGSRSASRRGRRRARASSISAPAGLAAGEVLAAGHRQPDRPAQRERGRDDQRLDDHHLAAEARRRAARRGRGRRSTGSPNSSASRSRVANGACVEVLTHELAVGSNHAVAVWVSR